MATLSYSMLSFTRTKDGVDVTFEDRFTFSLSASELSKIADYAVSDNAITFNCSRERAERRFSVILDKGLMNLRGPSQECVYVHKNSAIPLIGNLSFGLLHRGTNVIELKPQTGCNLNCIYCSVSEGTSSQKTDYYVEIDYMLEEFEKLSKFLNVNIEAHIGLHGEPLLYKRFFELCKRLSAYPFVDRITADTNGTLATKSMIDDLSTVPKLRLNFSLNAVDPQVCSKMSGARYNSSHVMKMIEYASSRMDVLIAPLYLPGYNDDELIKIVEFSKKLPKKDYPIVCCQNYLPYKTGRNPCKMLPWDKFISMLRDLERKTSQKLVLDLNTDFSITKTKQLPKPFRKGERLTARVVCRGRYKNTMIAASGNRSITVVECTKPVGTQLKLKLLRSKHNVFFAKVVN